jgi:hypothetical protein
MFSFGKADGGALNQVRTTIEDITPGTRISVLDNKGVEDFEFQSEDGEIFEGSIERYGKLPDPVADDN